MGRGIEEARESPLRSEDSDLRSIAFAEEHPGAGCVYATLSTTGDIPQASYCPLQRLASFCDGD